MINEEKLIKELEYYISHTNEDSGEHYAYKKSLELIKRQPKLDEWIPCSERLPKELDGEVFIYTRDCKMKTGIYSEFSNRWYVGDMCAIGGSEIIAWMPKFIYPYQG